MLVTLAAYRAAPATVGAGMQGAGADCQPYRQAVWDTTFSAELFEWRGPSPFFWLSLSPEACDYVRTEASEATYGWGAIPVRVRIGGTEWETSLLPRGSGYALPVKKYVRAREGFGEGARVTVQMSIAPRGGRAANGSVPAV